jgi:hypothetical protein
LVTELPERDAGTVWRCDLPEQHPFSAFPGDCAGSIVRFAERVARGELEMTIRLNVGRGVDAAGIADEQSSRCQDSLADHHLNVRRSAALPEYLQGNPQTIVALAYFDLDLYEPTRDALQAVVPHLTRGSVLAFDELGHAKWPGETAAFREVLGFGRALNILPGLGTLAYLRWDDQ